MNLDEALTAAWEHAERGLSPRDRQQIPRLKHFLQELENPHGRVLSARAAEGDPLTPNAASARALEAHIIARLRTRESRTAEAVAWLRIIHVVIRQLQSQGIALSETRLPAVLPSAPSPFSPKIMQSAIRTIAWREALHRGIGAFRTEPADPSLLWGAVLLSAVLHGALLDTAKLNRLVEHMSQGGDFHGTQPRCYFEFDLPYAGLGELHLQRWFPDALTALLLIRLIRHLASTTSSPFPKPHVAIRRFLSAQDVGLEAQPSGLRQLVESATPWWRARASALEVRVMTRQLPAHAIHRRSWQRIFGASSGGSEPKPRSAAPIRTADDDPASQDLIDNLPVMYSWLEPALQALATDQRSTARSAIATLASDHQNDVLAGHYLGFIQFLLAGNSATGKPLALSTIRSRATEALHRLLFHLGDDDPTRMTLDELQTLYAEISNESDGRSNPLALKTGLREFHTYLVRRHGLPHIQRLDQVLGDDAHLMPIDANLVTVDEYLATQLRLDHDLARGAPPDDVQIAKLVLMMAFRLGMRAMEIFGLRTEDVQLQGRGITILVRPYPGHRLKTENSKRILPAHALLAAKERTMLRTWVQRRLAEASSATSSGTTAQSDRLLTSVRTGRSKVSYEGVTDRVCAALRHATGDRLLFLHHLRHAFATWTMLRLRAPDDPEIHRFFATHPATERWLANGRRARLQLLGHIPASSRVYAFAVARLLGHSSPTVSMGHYIHGTEIVMAAIADRELREVPKRALVAASGLPATTAFRHLDRSSLELVAHTLKRQPKRSSGLPHGASEEAAEPPVKRVRGRPKAAPPHLGEQWLSFDRVRATLHLAALPHLSPVHIARQLQLPDAIVDTILAKAPDYGLLLGLAVTETNVPILSRPRLPAELALLSTFEERLARLDRKSPELCRAGLQLHLQHFNRQKHDVVFRGAQHADALVTYLQFLRGLGVGESEVQCVLRTLDDHAQPPAWISSTPQAQLPKRIRRIGPPTVAKASSYAQWLGIQLTEPDGNGLGQLAGVACMLGGLALEAKRR